MPRLVPVGISLTKTMQGSIGLLSCVRASVRGGIGVVGNIGARMGGSVGLVADISAVELIFEGGTSVFKQGDGARN